MLTIWSFISLWVSFIYKLLDCLKIFSYRVKIRVVQSTMIRGQEGPRSSSTRLGHKEVKLVSTELELQQMLTELNESSPSVIAVDAVGRALSRNGTLTFLAMCWNEYAIYVLDVQVRT